jgi:hypothetical protein
MVLKTEPLMGEERREARRAALLRRVTEAIVRTIGMQTKIRVQSKSRTRDQQAEIPEGRGTGI